MTDIPEIECPACDGHGALMPNVGLGDHECPACNGHGWRAMDADELADAAERQAEEAQFRAELSLDEQHMRAWHEHQELHRR